MRTVSCAGCRAKQPLGKTLDVFGETLCEACAGEKLEATPEADEHSVRRNIDPTVCGWCAADATSEYPLLANVPTCDECDRRLRNRPYPTWIKVSFAALVALAICSFAYNFRFMRAFFEARWANQAAVAGDLTQAADRMELAAESVPEVRELGGLAGMYRGLHHLAQDRPKEALAALTRSGGRYSSDPTIKRLIIQAELGVAFDDKRYDVMVERALVLAEMAPQENLARYSVASAYACRYAETGDEQFKTQSLQALKEADELSGPPTGDYRERILHRLETRTIIKAEEFQKQFPQGWKSAEKTP